MESQANATRSDSGLRRGSRALRGRERTHAVSMLFVALSCLCLTRAANAAPCDELGSICPRAINAESARGVAMGTGARATAMSTSALAYNPAALVMARVYHVEGVVDYMPDLQTVALGGAVIDSSTANLAAGLSLRGFLGGRSSIGGIDGRLALAFPLSDAISLGVAARYINVNRDDGTLMAKELHAAKGFTLDASLRVAPVPTVQLYFGSYNLINLDSVYTPLILGGGLGFTLGDIAVVNADVLCDLTSYSSTDVTVGGGLEILAGGTVPLRAGYSYDTKRSQHVMSLGLGYTDRTMGLDLSLRQDLGGIGDTRLMGAFRFYVH
jgi:hypothetical protein